MPRRSTQEMLESVFEYHRKGQHPVPAGNCFYCSLEAEYGLWRRKKTKATGKPVGKKKHRGAGNAPWMKIMRKERCHYCGGPGGTVDHVVPASQGGSTTKKNCVPACEPCNNFRGTTPYEVFKAGGWRRRPFAGTKMSLGGNA